MKLYNRTSDSSHTESYSQYIRDINKFELLSKEEEMKLGKKALKGNQKAIEKLVQSNLRLVVKYAHEFTGAGLPLMDLISEGNRGLVKAAHKFDPAKSKFSTYATYWIKQFIRRGLENQALEIRHPSHVIAAYSKIRKFIREHEAVFEVHPSSEEIAKGTKLPVSKVKRLMKETVRCVSWNEQIGEDGAERGDFLADEKAEDPAEMAAISSDHEMLKKLMLEVLSEKERKVLALRYGMGFDDDRLTLEDVGVHFDVTRERIRQIQAEAIDKLRACKEQLRNIS